MSYGYSRKPTYMRYARVYEILRGDVALSRKLSTNMVAVCLPGNQRHVDMPAEVIMVTDEIHKRGSDAALLDKVSILKVAMSVLILSPPTSTALVPSRIPSTQPAKPKFMTSLEVTLKERLTKLSDEIEHHKKQIIECEREAKKCRLALNALTSDTDDSKPEAEELVIEEPVAEEPVVEPVTEEPAQLPDRRARRLVLQDFEERVMQYLKKRPEGVLLKTMVDDFQPLSHSTCRHRVIRMARRGRIQYDHARIRL